MRDKIIIVIETRNWVYMGFLILVRVFGIFHNKRILKIFC